MRTERVRKKYNAKAVGQKTDTGKVKVGREKWHNNDQHLHYFFVLVPWLFWSLFGAWH